MTDWTVFCWGLSKRVKRMREVLGLCGNDGNTNGKATHFKNSGSHRGQVLELMPRQHLAKASLLFSIADQPSTTECLQRLYALGNKAAEKFKDAR